MKEVLTKRFWRDVTKTFYEALEGPPPKSNPSQAPAEVRPHESLADVAASSPSVQASSADVAARSKAG
jgi:hypothetical protein